MELQASLVRMDLLMACCVALGCHELQVASWEEHDLASHIWYGLVLLIAARLQAILPVASSQWCHDCHVQSSFVLAHRSHVVVSGTVAVVRE